MQTRTLQSEHHREEQTMKCTLRAAVFALALLLTPDIAARAFAATLSVSKIVVSQATQSNTNSVPLVAARSTVIRATIGVSGSLVNIPNVTARLYVYVDNVLKTPGGISPINPRFTAKLSPSDNNQNDTLNFELLAPTVMVPPAATSNTATVRFHIDLSHSSHTAVDYTSGNFTFHRRVTPRIYYTRLDYTPAGQGLPLVSMVQAGRGNQMVKGIYPVNDASPILYQPALAPTMSFSHDPNNDNIMQQSEGWELLDDLEAARQLIVDNNNGADDRTFLYGWIRGNPIDHNGQAVINGRVGYGNTEASRFQRTFAHELGHMFGFHHPNADAPKNLNLLGWDVGARLPDNPAGNNVSGRLKPLSLWDIMVGGKLTEDAWIRSDRYTALFNHDTLKPTFFLQPVVNAVAVNIFVHPGDPVQIEWRSVFRYPWLSGPSKRAQEAGRFILRARLADGSVHDNPFDVQMGENIAERDGVNTGPVSLILPYSQQINTLEVIDGTSHQILSRLNRSLLLPAVNVISPRRGAVLGKRTLVEFEVTDGDSDASEQKVHVAYSWDNGKSFVPVAVNLTSRTGRFRFEFDSAAVPPSNGEGMLRFFASDQGNTTIHEEPNLYTQAWITSKVTLQDCLYPTDQPVTVNIHYHDNDNNAENDYDQQVVTLAEDGSYTLVGVRPVDCSIQVKADKWLSQSVDAHLNAAGHVFADSVTLLAGDANNDNSADVLDLDLLIQAFDSEEGDPNFILGADFNCDTRVDVLDLALLITNFDKVGEPLP
jgi:hypothetical protein